MRYTDRGCTRLTLPTQDQQYPYPAASEYSVCNPNDELRWPIQ